MTSFEDDMKAWAAVREHLLRLGQEAKAAGVPCPPRHCPNCRLPENKPPFPYAGPLCGCEESK